MMSFCKGVASSRMMPRVPRYVGSTKGLQDQLTIPLQNVTINTIRGDKESIVRQNDEEIQPHLNSGLWAVYLEEAELRPLPLPEDPEKREAPGDANKPPVDPVVS